MQIRSGYSYSQSTNYWHALLYARMYSEYIWSAQRPVKVHRCVAKSNNRYHKYHERRQPKPQTCYEVRSELLCACGSHNQAISAILLRSKEWPLKDRDRDRECGHPNTTSEAIYPVLPHIGVQSVFFCRSRPKNQDVATMTQLQNKS